MFLNMIQVFFFFILPSRRLRPLFLHNFFGIVKMNLNFVFASNSIFFLFENENKGGDIIKNLGRKYNAFFFNLKEEKNEPIKFYNFLFNSAFQDPPSFFHASLFQFYRFEIAGRDMRAGCGITVEEAWLFYFRLKDL